MKFLEITLFVDFTESISNLFTWNQPWHCLRKKKQVSLPTAMITSFKIAPDNNFNGTSSFNSFYRLEMTSQRHLPNDNFAIPTSASNRTTKSISVKQIRPFSPQIINNTSIYLKSQLSRIPTTALSISCLS